HHPRRGDDLLRIPTLHDEWNPFAEPLPVFRVLHASIAMMRRERGMSLLQEGDVLGTLHEAHVRDGVDEGFWRPDGARPDEVGPELPREVKLDVDFERLRDVDAAVAPRRCVVQLTERGVAGAGVVPGTRALLGLLSENLEHLDPEIGLQLLQEDAQGHAHDAGSDEDDVRFVASGITRGTDPFAGRCLLVHRRRLTFARSISLLARPPFTAFSMNRRNARASPMVVLGGIMSS